MSKHQRISIGLLLAIVLQGAVLIGEYVNAAYPLWVGKEITLETRPVDPRSLFRGNYAVLRYSINTIPATALKSKMESGKRLRNGEVVYVSLKQTEKGTYDYADASLVPPEQGLYIRGRLANRNVDAELNAYHIRYGIEAYFAPKDKAVALEKELRSGAEAAIFVASNGKAALFAVHTN